MLPAAAIPGSGRTSGVALRRRRGWEEGRRGRRWPGEGAAARFALRGGRRGGSNVSACAHSFVSSVLVKFHLSFMKCERSFILIILI